MLSELKIALMVKHSDPLKYYGMKQERKLKIHDESYKRLKQLTSGQAQKQSETIDTNGEDYELLED